MATLTHAWEGTTSGPRADSSNRLGRKTSKSSRKNVILSSDQLDCTYFLAQNRKTFWRGRFWFLLMWSLEVRDLDFDSFLLANWAACRSIVANDLDFGAFWNELRKHTWLLMMKSNKHLQLMWHEPSLLAWLDQDQAEAKPNMWHRAAEALWQHSCVWCVFEDYVVATLTHAWEGTTSGPRADSSNRLGRKTSKLSRKNVILSSDQLDCTYFLAQNRKTFWRGRFWFLLMWSLEVRDLDFDSFLLANWAACRSIVANDLDFGIFWNELRKHIWLLMMKSNKHLQLMWHEPSLLAWFDQDQAEAKPNMWHRAAEALWQHSCVWCVFEDYVVATLTHAWEGTTSGPRADSSNRLGRKTSKLSRKNVILSSDQLDCTYFLAQNRKTFCRGRFWFLLMWSLEVRDLDFDSFLLANWAACSGACQLRKHYDNTAVSDVFSRTTL